MELVGKQVKHKSFGYGVIVEQNDAYVFVNFDSVVKKFQYPACFSDFLEMIDSVSTGGKNSGKKIAVTNDKNGETVSADSGSWAVQRTFESVAVFCLGYKTALLQEASLLKKTGGKQHQLYNGNRIGARDGQLIYAFESTEELTFPEGTQITLRQGINTAKGSVIGCEEFTVILSAGMDFGTEVPYLEISAEPWRLLEVLAERLDEIAERPSEIVRDLTNNGQNESERASASIARGQETALAMAKSQPITFVWGPPGTGKTETLAQIALEHIRQGNRVLMLSHSNVSVDGAVLRVYERAEKAKPGLIVRYGYARRRELLENDTLTTYNLAIRNHPDWIEEREQLLNARRKLAYTAPEYTAIGKKLSEIRNRLLAEEKQILQNAMFVATTASKAVVDSAIYEAEYDVVLFDEASMAYVPQIAFAASLAKKHFVCLGDFQQLPPIVQGSRESELHTDIFAYCGIIDAVNRGIGHTWLCMLDTQYRMHRQIGDFVSVSMYGGLLKNAEQIHTNRQAIADAAPMEGRAIAIADLSGMMSVCQKTADRSRVNVLSALFTFALARKASENNETGIITPYHAQSRLLHAMLRDTAGSEDCRKPISCATVHQFQGSEKNVILYDAVDCYRMTHPGILLTSAEHNEADRLFNVAMTRAKGKFVGIVNAAYMKNKLPESLMFAQLLNQQEKKTGAERGRGLLRNPGLKDDAISFFEEGEANAFFLKEVGDARLEIRMDIPAQPADEPFLEQLADALQDGKKRGVKVWLRAEQIAGLPRILQTMAIETSRVYNPIVILDKKTIWFGMPHSRACFRKGNRMIPTEYRPIIRFAGKHTAAALFELLEMSHTVDQRKTVVLDEEGNSIADNFACYVMTHKKCPLCGGPMKLQKSRKGRFFLACSGYPDCSETESVGAELVEDYFYRNGPDGQKCVRCRYSMEAKIGKYGLLIQCCGDPRHRYRLDET